MIYKNEDTMRAPNLTKHPRQFGPFEQEIRTAVIQSLDPIELTNAH